MDYPLAPVSLALCNADGSIRKTKKSSLYEAAMAELVILNPKDLPPKEELSTYFLDLAAAIRSQLKDCETIKQNNLIQPSLFLIPIYLIASKVVKVDSVVKAKYMSSSLPACDYLLICRISLGMVKTKKCSSICWKMLSLKKSRIYIK